MDRETDGDYADGAAIMKMKVMAMISSVLCEAVTIRGRNHSTTYIFTIFN